MSEHDPSPAARWPARLAIGLTGLWLLLGAGFKLFLGTPADLPQVVRDLPMELGLTYRLVIAVELVLVSLAFLRPRWAWLPLLGTLVVFDLILQQQIDAGAASCGCFGSKITMSPWVMLGIDSALFLAILLTRPWTTLPRKGAPVVLFVAVAAVGIALPWLLDREERTPAPTTATTSPSGTGGTSGPGGDGEVTVNGQPVRGGWVQLPLAKWVGMDIGETELGRRVSDVYDTPPDALWVLYRSTCDHCAKHLARMADEEIGQRFLVLCRLKEKNDTEENRLVHRMPTGDFVFERELPATTEYLMTTPGELEVQGFVVTRGEEGVPVDEE